MSTLIFMFAGQGSQTYHMGKSLYENQTDFTQQLVSMDELIQDLGGPSIIKAVYNPAKSPTDPFDLLTETHCAIFGFHLALAKTLRQFGLTPDMTFGVSLGSVAAATVSGILKLEDATAAVITNSQRIHLQALTHSDYRGKMIAVMAPHSTVHHLSSDGEFKGALDISAYNADNHYVLSIKESHADLLTQKMDDANIHYTVLPVTHPFHSSWMPPLDELESLTAYTAHTTQFCTASAQALQQHQINDSTFLAKMFQEPIQLQKSFSKISMLMSKDNQINVLDLSPNGTLAALMRQHLRLQGNPGLVHRINPIFSLFNDDLELFNKIVL